MAVRLIRKLPISFVQLSKCPNAYATILTPLRCAGTSRNVPTSAVWNKRLPSTSEIRKIVKNEGIMFPVMRVVFKNPETDETEWKIMNRTDALNFAQKSKLDLVVVNSNADPPVCKLEDFNELYAKQKEKKKSLKTSGKAKTLKEMFLKAGIDKHDFQTKMNKVKQFLIDGHPVRLSILTKKLAVVSLKKNMNALGMEDATLMALEFIEDLPITVQQQAVSGDTRRDFIITPKGNISEQISNVEKPL